MHELSVAHSLVEMASEAAREAGATRVREVRLAIGALSCVAPEALEFCFELASRDTPLAGARLRYRRLPVVIHCPTCREDKELEGIQSFRCPVCATPSADLRQGRELEIETLEIETLEIDIDSRAPDPAESDRPSSEPAASADGGSDPARPDPSPSGPDRPDPLPSSTAAPAPRGAP
ncbi:MAG: hydrogenase maturation nickel metallochaperone HypA [Holophagales bacterium]|nr:hydrogenase maturation nickel metallochaperone HypA [Holophagales bacterium]